jgi:2'-5' RNA ligase
MADAPTQRLFFAVMLPDALRTAVDGVRHRLAGTDRSVRWVRPEGLHLTVRFLGECTPAQATAAAAAGTASVAALAPFDVALGGLGVFPNPARPRVIWVGLTAGGPELTALHDRLEQALMARRVIGAPERFTAHLTLGRVREEVAPDARALLGRAITSAPSQAYGRFTATHLELIESVLGREGARYTTVASFPLGGAGPSADAPILS